MIVKRRRLRSIVLSFLISSFVLPGASCALVHPCHDDHVVPFFYDSSNNFHRDIQYHPEQAARIEACIQAIAKHKQTSGDTRIRLVDVADKLPETNSDSSFAVVHEPFSKQELEHARDMLVEAHSEELVYSIERRCRDSRQERIDDGKSPLGFIGYVDDDTYLTTETYDVCLRAAATWIRAVDLVLTNGERADGPSTAAMALTRPPGHHATSALSNGFCIFNFAAAAALHATHQGHYPNDVKVSILDWDVHYGQGVADIVMKHDNLRYVSIHQTPAFPYMGESRAILGDNKNVLTIPILADNTWTCGYKEYFNNIALPFVHSTEDSWEPDLVIVCAGYDALASDDLASVSLTAPDYGEMTRQLLTRLRSSQDKRPGIVLGLEGGYSLKEDAAGGNLADAVVETVRALVRGPCEDR